MKKYVSAAQKAFKVGDYVQIVEDNFHAGDWGIIRYINKEDGEYHVGMFGGEMAPVFYRNELKPLKYLPPY